MYTLLLSKQFVVEILFVEMEVLISRIYVKENENQNVLGE